MHDDGLGARLGEPLKGIDAILIVADQAGDLYPGDVVAAGGENLAAPERGGKRHDSRDGDQHRNHTPERELAPHAAAIDDQISIERHGWSPQRLGEQMRLSLVTVNGAPKRAAIVANAFFLASPRPAQAGRGWRAVKLRAG